MSIFGELSAILILATIVAFFTRILRQPLIVGYIITGIIVGPYGLNVLHSHELIETFSKIGITTLLFIVGLNLNPRVIGELGKTSLVMGLGQIGLTTLVGMGVSLSLGLPVLSAMYVSIALTLSSTIIILKLLSDKGDIQKLYGKLAIGILIIQDIVVSFILIFISAFSSGANLDVATLVTLLITKGIILFILLYLTSTYILPALTRFIATSQELLFLFSLAWGLGMATLFRALGFSVEIGALVAGVTLSVTPFALEIGSRLKPLRDFFVVLFFILLGSQMALDNIGALLLPALILSLFVLVGNPIIVIIIMNWLGYKRRTSYFTGLTMAQISEFSLILAALGYSIGHLSRDTVSLITLVGLITIVGSTYLIIHAEHLYPWMEKALKGFELRRNTHKEITPGLSAYEMILFGYGRIGRDFVSVLKRLDKPFMVVDLNPKSIEELEELMIPNAFGDAEDAEFLEELRITQAQMIVSTIPEFKPNLLLIQHVRAHNKKTIIIVPSHHIHEAQELYDNGASYVVMPHYLGAQYATHMISRLGIDAKGFEEEREKHLGYLHKRINQS